MTSKSVKTAPLVLLANFPFALTIGFGVVDFKWSITAYSTPSFTFFKALSKVKVFSNASNGFLFTFKSKILYGWYPDSSQLKIFSGLSCKLCSSYTFWTFSKNSSTFLEFEALARSMGKFWATRRRKLGWRILKPSYQIGVGRPILNNPVWPVLNKWAATSWITVTAYIPNPYSANFEIVRTRIASVAAARIGARPATNDDVFPFIRLFKVLEIENWIFLKRF